MNRLIKGTYIILLGKLYANITNSSFDLACYFYKQYIVRNNYDDNRED